MAPAWQRPHSEQVWLTHTVSASTEMGRGDAPSPELGVVVLA